MKITAWRFLISFCIVILKMPFRRLQFAAAVGLCCSTTLAAGTIAQWLFDEQKEVYPS